jgi:hypothetical protein
VGVGALAMDFARGLKTGVRKWLWEVRQWQNSSAAGVCDLSFKTTTLQRRVSARPLASSVTASPTAPYTAEEPCGADVL